MNDIILCGILNRTDPLKVTDALLLALIGILVVFIVLILLMLIVSLVGKIFDGSEKLKEKHPEWNDKVQNLKAKMTFWKRIKKKRMLHPKRSSNPLQKALAESLNLSTRTSATPL